MEGATGSQCAANGDRHDVGFSTLCGQTSPALPERFVFPSYLIKIILPVNSACLSELVLDQICAFESEAALPSYFIKLRINKCKLKVIKNLIT